MQFNDYSSTTTSMSTTRHLSIDDVKQSLVNCQTTTSMSTTRQLSIDDVNVDDSSTVKRRRQCRRLVNCQTTTHGGLNWKSNRLVTLSRFSSLSFIYSLVLTVTLASILGYRFRNPISRKLQIRFEFCQTSFKVNDLFFPKN